MLAKTRRILLQIFLTLIFILSLPLRVYAHTGSTIEVFFYAFLWVYAFFLFPLFAFIAIYVIIGVPKLILSLICFKRSKSFVDKPLFVFLGIESAILLAIYYLSLTLTEQEKLQYIVNSLSISESLGIKLFLLNSLKDQFFPFMMKFISLGGVLFLITFPLGIFFMKRYRLLGNDSPRAIQLISISGIQAASTFVIIFGLFAVYSAVPSLQPLSPRHFAFSSRKSTYITKEDNKEIRMNKMLVMAVASSVPELSSVLLKHGASANAVDRQGNPVMLSAFLKPNPTDRQDVIIDQLLNAGADINSFDARQVPIVARILTSQASQKSIDSYFSKKPNLEITGAYGSTPLLFLCERPENFPECKVHARSFLEKGANINAINGHGTTLFGQTLMLGDLEFADELLSKGAKPLLTKSVPMIPSRPISQSNQLREVSLVNRFFKESVWLAKLREVKYALSFGFDINTKLDNNLTALEIAVRNWKNEQWNNEMILFLLENGAKVNDHSFFQNIIRRADVDFIKKILDTNISTDGALIAAMEQNQTEIAMVLLERGVSTKGALAVAVKHNNKEAVKLLLENNADPNELYFKSRETVFQKAVDDGSQEIATLMLNKGALNIDSALYSAVEKSNYELAKLFLKRGADVDFNNIYSRRAPLWNAVNVSDLKMIRLLLEYGADPNIKDRWNRSPIQVAFTNGNKEIIRLLLDAGADPSIEDNYGRVLKLSAFADDKELYSMLTEKGVNVNHQDVSGKTELMNVVQLKKLEPVKFLIEHGADPNIQDKTGDTALSYAVQKGNNSIVSYLLESEADPNLLDIHGRSCLWNAVWRSDYELVSLLLENGIKIDTRDKYGRTVLWEIARKSHQLRLRHIQTFSGVEVEVTKQQVEVVGKEGVGKSVGMRATYNIGDLLEKSFEKEILVAKLLIDKGLDPSVKDNDGQTAHDVAIENENDRLAKFLSDYMKK